MRFWQSTAINFTRLNDLSLHTLFSNRAQHYRVAFCLFIFLLFVLSSGLLRSRSGILLRYRPASTPRWKTILKSQSLDNTVIPLVSQSNFWGSWEYVEFPPRDVFNPSFLQLPNDTVSNGSFAVVAREDGPWQRGQPASRWIVGGMVDLTDSEVEEDARLRWSITTGFAVTCRNVEQLPAKPYTDDTQFPKCKDSPNWLKGIQGPEDPRLFWSHLGEPLMIFNSISAEHAEICRHLYLTDLRNIYGPVRDLLSSLEEPAPVRFTESVPLLYPGESGVQKNWAPFSDSSGGLYFHTDLIPQTIYKLKSGNDAFKVPTFSSSAEDLEDLEIIVNATSRDNCITWAANQPAFKGFRVHQSTPFLDVVFCNYADVVSGICDPNDPANRLYIGVIHVMHNKLYERRIVTLNSTYPWNYVSVSKPLLYSMFTSSSHFPFSIENFWLIQNPTVNMAQDLLAFTASMNFRKRGRTTKSGSEYARGYLDDGLIISFGIGDKASSYVEVKVKDVLEDHLICDDLAREDLHQ
jgi:hypothetical protein